MTDNFGILKVSFLQEIPNYLRKECRSVDYYDRQYYNPFHLGEVMVHDISCSILTLYEWEQDQDLFKDQMESVVPCRSGPIVFLLGVFTNYTKLAIMPILASEALLRENKNFQ